MRRWKKFKLMMRRAKKYEPFEELNEVTPLLLFARARLEKIGSPAALRWSEEIATIEDQIFTKLQEWKDDPAAVDPRVSAQSDEVTQTKPLINLANQFAEMKIAAELLLKSKGVKIE